MNPARSTGTALFAGGWALQQLWVFWVAPIVGAVLGAVVYRAIGESQPLTQGQRDLPASPTTAGATP